MSKYSQGDIQGSADVVHTSVVVIAVRILPSIMTCVGVGNDAILFVRVWLLQN